MNTSKCSVGKKFGRLTIIKLLDVRKGGSRVWECICDCGNTKNVKTNKLKNSHTQSCGCFQKECAKKSIINNSLYIKDNNLRGHRWNGVGDLSGTYFDSIRLGAKSRNLEFNISKDYLWNLFLKQKRKCILSGIDLVMPVSKKIKGNASVDRIDSSIGYIDGNIQWIHKDINKMKMAIPQNRFVDLCKLIALQLSKNVGLLYNTRVYLGGNIENSNDFCGWRDDLAKEFEKLSIICLDPTKDVFIKSFIENKKMNQTIKKWREDGEFDKLQRVMKKIVSKDLRMVDICDFAIFRLEPETPTFGTIHELINCATDRKPILILIDDKHKLPLWILRYVDMNCVFENKSSLMSFLISVDKKEKTLDDRFWKILQPEYRMGFSCLKREKHLNSIDLIPE